MSIYSSMYYEPNFELGEDIRTEERARQDDEWKNAVQDGRAHVSHREATATHAERLAYSIYTHHQVEAIVDCITGVVGKKNHLYGLDKYMGFTIVEFLHGVGHGFLLTAAVARRLVKPSPPSRPTDAMAFRLCVRKRPLLSFEVLEGSRHSQPYTAEEAAGVSRIPYDACCATLQPLGQCVCLHDGKLARNGRRLSMQHHVTFADRVWCEREENAAFCTAELLPLLAHVAPATAATAAATAVAAGAGASATAGGDGRRATLICFGQTGTGKTFTLNACLQYLARALMGGRGSSATTATAGTDSPAVLAAYEGCTVHIKFFEVHGKKCYDLLDARKEVKLLADGADVMHLRGAKSHQLDSSEGGAGAAEARVAHMLQCLQGALALRSAQVTERNPVSSRSHAVCELTVHFACDAASAAANAAQSREVAPRRTGTIRLVDLAGSERNYETLKMSAKDHAESADINTALMALKDCFRASAAQAKGCGLTVSASAEYRKGNAKKAVSSYEGHCGSSRTKGGGETEAAERKAGMQQQKAKVVRKSPSDRAAASSSATTAAGSVHIPFRAHILTRVLKDCFVAPASESRTTVVATVSPSPIDLVHSLNTLEHAVLMCPKLEQVRSCLMSLYPCLLCGMLYVACTWHRAVHVPLNHANPPSFPRTPPRHAVQDEHHGGHLRGRRAAHAGAHGEVDSRAGASVAGHSRQWAIQHAYRAQGARWQGAVLAQFLVPVRPIRGHAQAGPHRR